MKMADNYNNKWATVCIVDGGGGVDIFDPNVLLARQSHHTPRIIKVLVLLLVRIVRVQHRYLNLQICKYQFLVLTSQVDPIEYSMHTKHFRYKKCALDTVETGNVYLNPS
jgi:hypothetical protein